MEINRTNINDIVFKTNTRPDKDYGQNFLIEPSISEEISNLLNLSSNDKVLEVGPGLGSLTHFLYGKCDLAVVDIDYRMIDFLKGVYEDRVSYILEDVRKVDVSSFDKIIGNLPYNITSELILFLLSNASNCRRMVLMCQQETFNHFSDVSGKEYGPISVLLHLLGDCKKELTVKAGSFYPVPKCNSIVFTFDYAPVCERETAIKVYKFAKALFLNRRKTIYNNLKNYLGDKDKAESVLKTLNIDLNKRPEDISPSLFLEIYKTIK